MLGLFKATSQTADVAISYVLREVQISLAKEYNKELGKSLIKFTEYSAENLVFYETTKLGSTRASTYLFTFPTNPCISKWGPLKFSRCQKKITLLNEANTLVRLIPMTNTTYTPKSAVQSRIMVKTNTILKNINKELLKH